MVLIPAGINMKSLIDKRRLGYELSEVSSRKFFILAVNLKSHKIMKNI
jgi:hypothetical protein